MGGLPRRWACAPFVGLASVRLIPSPLSSPAGRPARSPSLWYLFPWLLVGFPLGLSCPSPPPWALPLRGRLCQWWAVPVMFALGVGVYLSGCSWLLLLLFLFRLAVPPRRHALQWRAVVARLALVLVSICAHLLGRSWLCSSYRQKWLICQKNALCCPSTARRIMSAAGAPFWFVWFVFLVCRFVFFFGFRPRYMLPPDIEQPGVRTQQRKR